MLRNSIQLEELSVDIIANGQHANDCQKGSLRGGKKTAFGAWKKR